MSDSYNGAMLGRLILGQGVLGTTGETSILDTLIYDRTQADVDNKTAKGYYNSEDMTRVDNAMAYIIEKLSAIGYDTIKAKPQLRNWVKSSVPRVTITKQYCADVIEISKIINYGSKLTLPTSLDKFDYKRANNIEKVLHDTGMLTENIPSTWYYCGEIETGGVI